MFETVKTRGYDLFNGLCMIIGREEKDWIHFEPDPVWWSVRLWTRRN